MAPIYSFRFRPILLTALTLLAGAFLTAPRPAAAQTQAQRLIGSFLSTGGYFLTDSTGQAALGDAKFLSYAVLYGRPRHYDYLRLSGGFEFFNLSDHFFPFTGGNDFTMTGPSFRISTNLRRSPWTAFLSGGLYLASIRSDRFVPGGISRSDFTPGLTVGIDWKVGRYVSLSAGYRMNERLAGINTDGFMLLLRFF